MSESKKREIQSKGGQASHSGGNTNRGGSTGGSGGQFKAGSERASREGAKGGSN